MTVGASLRKRSVPAGSGNRLCVSGGVSAGLPGATRTLVLATALIGLVEVLLLRVAAPILTHASSGIGSAAFAEAVRSSGNSALRASALLAPLALIALAATAWQSRRGEAVLLLATTVGALAAVVAPAATVVLAAHLLTISLVAYLAVAATRSFPIWHAIGVGLLSGAFVAGRWPLVADALSDAGLLTITGPAGAAQTIVEAALVAAPVALAVGVISRGVSARWAWRAAVVAGAVVATMIAVTPEHLAITTLWAFGVTLSLPPIGYALAAASLGLVTTEWLVKAQSRGLAAGVVLVAVAGVTPAVVHHNLTAVAGLALLALPLVPRAVASSTRRED